MACVGVRGPRREAVGVSLSEAWMSADLGCSSEYSNGALWTLKAGEEKVSV